MGLINALKTDVGAVLTVAWVTFVAGFILAVILMASMDRSWSLISPENELYVTNDNVIWYRADYSKKYEHVNHMFKPIIEGR